MVNAIFYHKPDSVYKDKIDERYHFPHQYLSRVKQTVGSFIIYYGPKKDNGPSYISIARVTNIIDDPISPKHYYANVESYIDFDRPVHYKENGGFESKLFKPDGTVNGGRSVQAIRLIEKAEFSSIVEAGLSAKDDWPDRYDEKPAAPKEVYSGMQESHQLFIERPIVEQLTSRKFRDKKFAQNIKRLYDRTCAFTGLRLINGHGRPEVVAAHIVPVEHNGSDAVQNGIALSGTVHWMFDRGLLSLEDDFSILKSRHLNHDVTNLLVADMKALVPSNPNHRPHVNALRWHRENCFKQ
ncbi:MAG: HNH endonuclease [Nitratireductor sp.]